MCISQAGTAAAETKWAKGVHAHGACMRYVIGSTGAPEVRLRAFAMHVVESVHTVPYTSKGTTGKLALAAPYVRHVDQKGCHWNGSTKAPYWQWNSIEADERDLALF